MALDDAASSRIAAHMNKDHASSLLAYAWRDGKTWATRSRMVHISTDKMQLMATSRGGRREAFEGRGVSGGAAHALQPDHRPQHVA